MPTYIFIGGVKPNNRYKAVLVIEITSKEGNGASHKYIQLRVVPMSPGIQIHKSIKQLNLKRINKIKRERGASPSKLRQIEGTSPLVSAPRFSSRQFDLRPGQAKTLEFIFDYSGAATFLSNLRFKTGIYAVFKPEVKAWLTMQPKPY